MEVSKEYQHFIDSEKRGEKLSVYEKLCEISESLISMSPGKGREKTLQDAIDFCHLKCTPKGTFSFAVISTLVLFSIIAILSIAGLFSLSLMILSFLMLIPAFYFLYNYPMSLLASYKIKASSEMVLCIIYMSVSMKVRPNLENAIKFTASNLSGPLAKDLNELLWATYSGKYSSLDRSLDDFINKWKAENNEFTESFNLIKTSFYEGQFDRETVLDEAVNVVLDGTRDRMKRYSQELRPTLTIMNALGILLPIIGLILFPMLGFFMADAVKPIILILGYNIFLPLIIVFLMKSSLKKRPASFHQPKIKEKKGLLRLEIILPVALVVLVGGFSLFKIIGVTEKFDMASLVFSTLSIVTLSAGIILYSFLSSYKDLKLRNDIIQMESELGVVLFQLGYHIRGGMSIETAVERLIPRIKELKVHALFTSTVNNIKTFGMTFASALFNEQNGVIHIYPSSLIKAVMNAISEISRSGSVFLSSSLISISKFLKNMNTVEEYLREMLAEVTSTMKTQALLLAPLASGIVVGLSSMMTKLLINLVGWVGEFQGNLGDYGPIGGGEGGILSSLIDVSSIMPVHHFQLIVGIYMIEVVTILSYFLTIIESGDDKIMRKYNLAKTLLIATLVYLFSLILVYSFLTGFMPDFGGI